MQGSVDLTIHRAASQIGGNCVELRCGADRLILDAGLPLDALDTEMASIPTTLDLSGQATVLVSHPHLDHYGLLPSLPASWPVWCGPAAASLMELSARLGRWKTPPQPQTWRHRHPFAVGPFRITPLLTDHSAFDASMLHIEVAGQRLLYTGDFRMHGRKADLVRRLMDRPPPNIDVLVMEGTTLGRSGAIPSESDVEASFSDLFNSCPGRVFVGWAGSNVDRTVSLARACLRDGRPLVVDIYTADVLKRLVEWSPRLPQPGRKPVITVITSRLAALYRKQGQDTLVSNLAKTGISVRDLRQVPQAVIMVRAALLRDYQAAGLLPTAQDAWCWSQWRGYLDSPKGREVSDWFKAGGCPGHQIHTSGHASPDDLRAFSTAMRPRCLVPIHGEHWDEPMPGFPTMRRLRDGQTMALD